MPLHVYPWLLLVTFSLSARAQDLAFPIRSEFSWEKMEKKVSSAQVEQFIHGTPTEFENFKRPSKYNSLNLDSLPSRLHFLDINGDGLLDVIFDGESGGEVRLIDIFVNLGTGYKKTFSGLQSVKKMDWRDGRLYRLYLYDWGCCADYLNIDKIYQLTNDKPNSPRFVQMYQATFVNATVFPEATLEKPFRFEVLNDKYNIRFAPAVDDTSEQLWTSDAKDGVHGNVIGRLAKGARGTVLNKRTDTSGREWWFVEVDEEFYPTGNVLLKEEQNDFPTKVVGWISSRFAKII